MRVLCLEDSPADAELVHATLAGVFQLEMDVASDRPSFEKLLASGSYDVILADYALPGFDAHGALELAKAACPTTPFICVSGTIGEEATVELLKEGADDCVLKNRLARLPFAVQRAIDEKVRERALLLSQEKYATAFHASPDSMTITRLHDGKLVEVNEGYERLLGYTRAESIGKTTAELSAYADSGTRDRLVTRLREAGEVKDFDATLRRKDGTSVAVIVSARVLDFRGEECFLAVVHDITKRKKAEQERLRAERFFRDTFEHADVGIAHVNSTDGSWLRVNQRLCDLLGYTREELSRTTFAAITHPDDVEENVRHLHRMLAGDEDTYAAEKRYLRKDGSIIWVHLNVTLIRKEDGTPDYNITVLTDITERKRAEEALAASERFRGRLLDTTPNLIYIYDLVENRNVYTNREIIDFLGYTPEAVLGFGSALFERILHPDDAALVAEHHARLQKLAPGDDSVLEVDYRMKRADDEWRWLHSRDIPFARDESGAVTRILGSTEDITERRQDLERLTRALKSTVEIVGQVSETRDPYTAGHQRRVSELAVRISHDMGMTASQTEQLRVSALIHDIGKMSVPTEILSKPGQLSAVEFELVKGHAEAGYEIIAAAHMEGPTAEIVRQHHERCDGSGYPRGLGADDLLLEAKVLMVADVVEAMTSHRPYRAALGIEAALDEIERGTGSLYDADVSRACLALFREGHFELSA